MQFVVSIEGEDLEELLRLANKWGIKPAQAVKEAIEIGIDEELGHE